jgi:SAM-dependent methyltransferase
MSFNKSLTKLSPKHILQTRMSGQNNRSGDVSDYAKIYYNNQAYARGILTQFDVEALIPRASRIYDSLLMRYLPQDRTCAIYEVACGPGIALLWLKSHNYSNVRGTDISEAYVKTARDLGLNASVADSVRDLENSTPGSLDVILAIDFIEHLPKDIFLAFLYRARSALKTGGVLILRAPNGDSPLVGRNLFNDITHHWAYTTVALQAIAKIVGFQQVNLHDEADSALPYRLKLLAPIIWGAKILIRYLLWLATREKVRYLGPNLFVVMKK